MSNPEHLTQLLDAAKAKAGSDYKLAELLHVPRQHVSAWRKGTRTVPPEDQAAMADIAGFDPVQELCRAHIERHEGTKKGANLLKILGKKLQAIGEGAALSIAGLVIISEIDPGSSFIRCIEGLSPGRLHPQKIPIVPA